MSDYFLNIAFVILKNYMETQKAKFKINIVTSWKRSINSCNHKKIRATAQL